jgi:hypothetical protein
VIVALQGCVIVALQGCVIVVLQGCAAKKQLMVVSKITFEV